MMKGIPILALRGLSVLPLKLPFVSFSIFLAILKVVELLAEPSTWPEYQLSLILGDFMAIYSKQ